MKAMMVLLASGLLSSVVYANDSLKISTVKDFYDNSLFYDSDIEGYNSDPETIYSYADESLTQALRLQENVGMTDGICGEYVSPLMWDSGDPFYDTELSYAINRDGRVEVKMGYGGSALYSLQCSQSSCKITDIISREISLKNSINKECR